jgi:tungstate transport system ATP-binding protein
VSAAEVILMVDGVKVALGGVTVLDIPSFCLHEKEIVTVVGPNGSGKSTLLLTLACLLKPAQGRISYRGNALDSQDAAFQLRRKISMVFQEPLLFDTTVYKNVAAGLSIRGLSRNDMKDRVMKYLKYFNIEHLSGRSARKLSGGESQRVSLARAFAIEPEIIFLDEPFSSLDPPTRHALTHDLDRIVRETGTTTVMVTHVESEALRMSDRIIVMNDGRIVQAGSPSVVRNNPINEFVAKFVGMENILQGRVLERQQELLKISIPGKELYAVGQAQPDEEVICCIRPENVSIVVPDAGGVKDGRSVFKGRITHIYSMGPFLKLGLDCGFPMVSLVTQELFVDLNLAEGKEICISFKPAAVHLIDL